MIENRAYILARYPHPFGKRKHVGLSSRAQPPVFYLSLEWIVGLDMLSWEHNIKCRAGVFQPIISKKTGIPFSGVGLTRLYLDQDSPGWEGYSKSRKIVP